jgi:hypothetical protein
VVEEGTQPPVPLNPCDPPPCGPHSQCQVVSGQAECSCLPGKIGRVPNCRPECTVSSDCLANEACVGQKCVDPCPGSCAQNAECRVVNHSPVCTCRPGYSGDAYIQCNVVPGECCVASGSALILTSVLFVSRNSGSSTGHSASVRSIALRSERTVSRGQRTGHLPLSV